MQFIGLRILLNRIRVIPALLKDKTVSKLKKFLVIAGIIYLFIPIDLIPFVPLDDFLLWLFILLYLRNELDKYWSRDPKADLSKKFHDRNLVEGVEFTVEGDSGDSPSDSENETAHEERDYDGPDN